MDAGAAEQRDLRQLLIHRHKLVEIRTRVKNGLQHLAMNRGMQKKRRLWSAGRTDRRCASCRWKGWAACRRRGSAGASGQSGSADRQTGSGAEQRRDRAPTGAAADDATRGGSDHRAGVCADHRRGRAVSQRGKQVASYLGLIPREHSSGGKQQLGAISKQGNRFVRMLLVEAAQTRRPLG